MPSEFQLIARYFTRPVRRAVLGVGDDAALCRVAPGMELAASTDMLVSGTHFAPHADPRRLGHKALAVNVSDLAAMGATPRWALLSLSLPGVEPAWLRAFSRGFFALADRFGVDLIGGDTTRGPLNLSVTILGEVPRGQALRRDRARIGDDIWVSGELGTAALGLAHQQGRVRLPAATAARCLRALDLPQPRVALGLGLRGLAHAAIDVSDGLTADLGHICERSGLGADLRIDRIPCAAALAKLADRPLAEQALVAGGDDYELCFTAARRHRGRIEALGARLGLRLGRVGCMRAGRGVRLLRGDGSVYRARKRGFDHFG
jgi:thiamine-monophosphate kinase